MPTPPPAPTPKPTSTSTLASVSVSVVRVRGRGRVRVWVWVRVRVWVYILLNLSHLSHHLCVLGGLGGVVVEFPALSHFTHGLWVQTPVGSKNYLDFPLPRWVPYGRQKAPSAKNHHQASRKVIHEKKVALCLAPNPMRKHTHWSFLLD